MGVSEDETDCNLKHRIIPKLTADKADKKRSKEAATTKQESADQPTKKKQETPEERLERISNTQITFSDFFLKCLDHEMLKLFFVTLFLFFCAVGVLTCIYLAFIYFFKYAIWQMYFPTEEMIQKMNRKEL